MHCLADVFSVQRFVSMELFYFPKDGKDYKPAGFVPGKSDHLKFAHAEGWEKRTTHFKELQSFFHGYVLLHRLPILPYTDYW